MLYKADKIYLLSLKSPLNFHSNQSRPLIDHLFLQSSTTTLTPFPIHSYNSWSLRWLLQYLSLLFFLFFTLPYLYHYHLLTRVHLFLFQILFSYHYFLCFQLTSSNTLKLLWSFASLATINLTTFSLFLLHFVSCFLLTQFHSHD